MSREREREHAWELVIIKPSVPIKPMLEKEGYPFKSKFHSRYVREFQTGHKDNLGCRAYYERTSKWSQRICPKRLLYQFDEEWKDLKISDKCCDRLKKEPMHKWQRQNNKSIVILGIMTDEGGRRESAKCTVFNNGKLKSFQPLVPVTKEWEDWFIEEYNIDISDIYKEPYNFARTGCKACPFGLELQYELDTLKRYFPNEYKQCEAIWKPVYDEYRRIGYRLRKPDGQMTLEDYLNEENR